MAGHSCLEERREDIDKLLESVDNLPSDFVPEKIKDEIERYANDFLKWLGADIRISKRYIKFGPLSYFRELGRTITLKNGEPVIYFDTDVFLFLDDPEDIREFLWVIFHELYHFYIFLKYGKNVDIDAEKCRGPYSEPPAYLLSLYFLLKESRYLIIYEDLTDPHKLVNWLAAYIFANKSMDKTIKTSQKGLEEIVNEFIKNYENLGAIAKEAMEEAKNIIKREREYLLVNKEYRELFINYLSQIVKSSLKPNSKPFAYCMAEKAIDLLYKKYEEHRNLEDALRNFLKSYLEYKESAIKECENSKEG